MATTCGLSQSTVSRIWRAFGLQPHRTETFKLSQDPLFIEKVRDVVGLYLNPPDKALVLCVDEKPHIQALERAQGYLKLPDGRALTGFSHEYKRHGTTTLFAAPAALGEVAAGGQRALHLEPLEPEEFGHRGEDDRFVVGDEHPLRHTHTASVQSGGKCEP